MLTEKLTAVFQRWNAAFFMGKKVTLKPKEVTGRITTLKALPYEGHMVYVRMIGTDLVEWMLVFNDQIYSSYMIFTPMPGKKELSPEQQMVAAGILWAGATATIDSLMGKKLDKETEATAKILAELN